MKTSATGINLIKQHEWLKLRAYKCPAGIWTIGYGHTATAKQGMVITEMRAHELLLSDVKSAEAIVNGKFPAIAQNRFDALVDFVFNLGGRQFLNSTLLKKIILNASETEIRAEFAKWIYASGKVQPGLVARRKEEADLFFKQI